LTLAGKQIAKIRGAVRLVTTTQGKTLRLIATEPDPVTVLVQNSHGVTSHNLNPDNVIAL
jgi:hypothetical protein